MSTAPTVLASRLLARARFRHLQVLVRLAELGSFSRAAQAVGLTQPAVTHVLAELERLLETRLFDRGSRGVTPTAAGTAILPVVRRMLESIDEIADIAAALHRDGASLLRIGAISGAISAVLARAQIGEWSQRHGVLVEIQEGDVEKIQDWVARDAIDLALIREPAIVPVGWSFERLLDDGFVVLCDRRHPLAQIPSVPTEALWKYPWMLGPLASAPRRALEQWTARENAAPELRLIATRSMAVAWMMLKEEPLLSLMPYSIACSWLEQGELARLPVEVPFTIEPLGVLSPRENASELVSLFVAHLRQCCATGNADPGATNRLASESASAPARPGPPPAGS
ncbi:MAG: LysR family transcriptional regulator [Pigmentiphaga sp.]|nr:LysR family transcriptional regulator [Pigmentiphaga sp.]